MRDQDQGPETIAAQPREVLTLDNIAVELPIAEVGSRVLAGAMDYFVLLLLGLGWMVTVVVIQRSLSLNPGWIFALFILGWFSFEAGYFAISEIVFSGRTLGKRMMGLRVVGHEGGTAGPGSLLIRNLIRSVDILIGVPLMAFDGQSRRLGDRLAGTLVVHTQAAEDEVVIQRLPQGWGAEEVALVEAYFRRLWDLEPGRSWELAAKLFALVERDDPAFLVESEGIRDPRLRLMRAFRVR